MDYRESTQETAFRTRVRDWLALNAPRNWREEATTDLALSGVIRRWQRALCDAGLMGLSWPVESGGQGLNATYEAILNDELGRADTPRISFHNYLGRAIFTYGTEAQKKRFLSTMLNGEVQWCQGFSEPGAGSDLAALSTHAVLKGDHYVVNGQKLWTSGALHADWCLLLVRTDREAAKHRGITCLLTSLRTPGITIRPVHISDGSPETCEMFLDDVVVPADQQIGECGAGWQIAMTVLAFERGPADVGLVATYQAAMQKIENMIVARGRIDDPEARKALARAYVDGEALRLNVIEQLSMRSAGRPPGPDGSVARLLLTQAEQSIRHLEMDVAGADALTGRADATLADYLRSRTISIFGGTSEIQKNILARQVLGMPR